VGEGCDQLPPLPANFSLSENFLENGRFSVPNFVFLNCHEGTGGQWTFTFNLFVRQVLTETAVVDEPSLNAQTSLPDLVTTDCTLAGEQIGSGGRQIIDSRVTLGPTDQSKP